MSAPTNLVDVTSTEHFQGLLSADLERVSLISFWAQWAEPCKQMNEVVKELAKKYSAVLVLQVEEAESGPLSDIFETFEIDSVPSFVLLRGHTLLGRVEGADAKGLSNAVEMHAPSPRPQSTVTSPSESTVTVTSPPSTEETKEELHARIRTLLNQSKVVLFMKGSPDAPRCGFSRKIVALLRDEKVEFTHFDILMDEDVRQELKVINAWPTYPQLIINGELVGGLDVVKDMVESGEFQELVA